MGKMDCNIINDLLPLYIDDVLSDESRQLVEEHLADCPSCQGMLEIMNKSLELEEDRDVTPFKRLRRKLIMRGIGIGLLIMMIALVVLVPIFQKPKAITTLGENFKKDMQVTFLDDGVYLRREKRSISGDLMVVDINNGVIKYCICESTLDFFKFQRSNENVRYSQLAEYSPLIREGDIKEVDYCDMDGNVLYVLWERE